MEILFDKSTQRVPIHCWADDADEQTLRQARNVAGLPIAVDHVALMPDAHVGFGMPIGGVLAAKDAIVPYAVGMDIGCGMVAWNTGLPHQQIRDRIEDIASGIRRDIPTGFTHRKPAEGRRLAKEHCPELFDLLEGTDPKKAYLSGHDKIIEQVGTLGGGNHFIELQLDPDDTLWVMVHSGSRNIGKLICDHFHKAAKRVSQERGFDVPDPALSYLPIDSSEGQDYLDHMTFAQKFARLNRQTMMRLCQKAVARKGRVNPPGDPDDLINIHHNYAARETHDGQTVWVHRKGATSAQKGQLGIIPGSMGTRSFIVRGLGNPDAFASCSHGAGRVMGRKQAKRTISMERFKESMRGIHFKATPAHLDEAPDAYKDIGRVMANQQDLVEIVTELRPIAVVKG